jgi:hypothetical protein
MLFLGTKLQKNVESKSSGGKILQRRIQRSNATVRFYKSIKNFGFLNKIWITFLKFFVGFGKKVTHILFSATTAVVFIVNYLKSID